MDNEFFTDHSTIYNQIALTLDTKPNTSIIVCDILKAVERVNSITFSIIGRRQFIFRRSSSFSETKTRNYGVPQGFVHALYVEHTCFCMVIMFLRMKIMTTFFMLSEHFFHKSNVSNRHSLQT